MQPMEKEIPTIQDSTANNYQIYLLRVWRNDSNEPWRVTVHRTGEKELQHFASLSEFYAAFWQRLSDSNHQEQLPV
ncbi:MAG: hypothetical protein H3C34_01535 [Caldilineaceae bacterium]|nr:hypothetical protein [Caldilineaceae bacterium]